MDSKKIELRSDISITGNSATFSLSHQGAVNGTYIGQFSLKCFLLPLEKLAIGRERRQLLGEYEAFATENEKFFAMALSELKYRIISSPPFWSANDNGNLPDEDVVVKVLDAAYYAEAMYAQQKREEKEKLLEKSMKAAEEIAKKNHENTKIDKEVEELDDEVAG